jgi:hypothetical protein
VNENVGKVVSKEDLYNAFLKDTDGKRVSVSSLSS